LSEIKTETKWDSFVTKLKKIDDNIYFMVYLSLCFLVFSLSIIIGLNSKKQSQQDLEYKILSLQTELNKTEIAFRYGYEQVIQDNKIIWRKIKEIDCNDYE